MGKILLYLLSPGSLTRLCRLIFLKTFTSAEDGYLNGKSYRWEYRGVSFSYDLPEKSSLSLYPYLNPKSCKVSMLTPKPSQGAAKQ